MATSADIWAPLYMGCESKRNTQSRSGDCPLKAHGSGSSEATQHLVLLPCLPLSVLILFPFVFSLKLATILSFLSNLGVLQKLVLELIH